MRTTTVIIASAVSSMVLGIPAAAQARQDGAPASSDTRNTPVVTKAEYRKVHDGTDLTRVHRVFGTSGKKMTSNPGDPLANQPATQSREYRTGSKYGFVSVYYVRVDGAWVVTRKAVYWG
jgi:hypothetical protein